MSEPIDTPELTAAACDVIRERERQINEEGFGSGQDDGYVDGELARAGAAYAIMSPPLAALARNLWPWPDYWKPTGTRRNLVKAAALLLAEIERLDRLGEVAK